MTVITEQCGPLTLVYDDGHVTPAEHLEILRREFEMALAIKDMDRAGELLLEILDVEDAAYAALLASTKGAWEELP